MTKAKRGSLDPSTQIAAALGGRVICPWCAPHFCARLEGRSSDHARCDDFECGCHCQDRTRVN